jgi:hypothetical protein
VEKKLPLVVEKVQLDQRHQPTLKCGQWMYGNAPDGKDGCKALCVEASEVSANLKEPMSIG